LKFGHLPSENLPDTTARHISLAKNRISPFLGAPTRVMIPALSPLQNNYSQRMKIGPYQLANKLVLAPMAGVTDRPFRQLCKRMGAGMAVSEMVSSNSLLWGSAKTLRRANHDGETEPKSVQIAGADPQMMADAARHNVERGAQIIDINMGCPAKKVCNVFAGSALLQDETLVGKILEAVVAAVEVPVTLKIRTGWDKDHRNGVAIARIAEQAGVQALAVHGRTRACAYKGEAEYDTIAAIKQAIAIPVIANGDITSPEKARFVLEYTGADGVMIGRAAQGRPWIFREILHFLETGTHLPEPPAAEIRDILLEHLRQLYDFYGEHTGVRMARKHISWYSKGQREGASFRHAINRVQSSTEQLDLIRDFFERLVDQPQDMPASSKHGVKGLAA
jgi:tRNA-dihydrouridine synthase B